MNKVLAIAFNTFKEAVRNRILYLLLVFALIIMASSGIIGELTISSRERIIKNLGITSINFFGMLVAIFVGIGLVYNELDKKTIYTIVTKPIDRYQFLLGKYLGLLLTIYINVIIMTFFFLAVVHYQSYMDSDAMTKALWTETGPGIWDSPGMGDYILYYLKAIVFSGFKALGNLTFLYSSVLTRNVMAIVFYGGIELAIITAFAILYSSFSTPTLSAMLTIMTFIVGRLNADIIIFADRIARRGIATGGDQIKYLICKAAALITPNLWLYNKGGYLAEDAASLGFDKHAVLYGIFYCAGVIFLAITIFRRRNFK